ncbi:hypothetical protein IE4872_CH03268 [Rhizobium gallicum]|uniref:Uncharacterized protein n=1 Tax=Rhizobium gallicum TaxID=56730 RepID=A0A1L5NLW1_9HYPH|nr:hypothetical protein IE4872_CH03268 [Rhizobium gallicum]
MTPETGARGGLSNPIIAARAPSDCSKDSFKVDGTHQEKFLRLKRSILTGSAAENPAIYDDQAGHDQCHPG